MSDAVSGQPEGVPTGSQAPQEAVPAGTGQVVDLGVEADQEGVQVPQEPDPAPAVEVQSPPEGKIFGSDLEAALDEKLTEARGKAEGEAKHWGFRGSYYKLRPHIPGSTVLTSMELANEKRADKLIELIKAFFVDDEGDRFVDALKGEIADLEPGAVAQMLQMIVTDLFGIYGNRPLAK